MASFIFKKDGMEVDLASLRAGPLKDAFQNLKTTIATQLKSLECEIHHHEPIIILQSQGNTVNLTGFSTCCNDFTMKIQNLIRLPEGIPSPAFVINMRKITHYSGA